MVHSPDPALNLRADIKASMIALESYVRMGGYRRAASIARELESNLNRLADLEQPNDQPRHRRVEPPPSPDSGEAYIGERLAGRRYAAQRRTPSKRRIVITQVEPPALGPGA